MRSMLRSLMLCCAVLAAACGGDDDPIAPVTEASVVGVWNLRSVNGSPIPFPLAQTVEVLLQLRSASITLTADRQYLDIQNFRISRIGQQDTLFSDTITGTWTLSGNEMVVSVSENDGGGQIPLLFVNNQALKLESGFTYSYRK